MSYRKNIKRKGFTLVELLIVIVVIGILSAMMMLSSNEAVSSAKANNIIANLRNLKTAALAWYADNPDYVNNTQAGNADKKQLHFGDKDGRKGILSYLGNTGGEVTTVDGNDNTLVVGGFQYVAVVVPHKNQSKEKLAGAKWYISCNIDEKNSTKNIRIREKLAGRAKSVGLLSNRTDTDTEAAPYNGSTGGTSTGSGTTVYYLIH